MSRRDPVSELGPVLNLRELIAAAENILHRSGLPIDRRQGLSAELALIYSATKALADHIAEVEGVRVLGTWNGPHDNEASFSAGSDMLADLEDSE